MSPKVASIGECMLELSACPGGEGQRAMQLGYGGDTLNTAIYLARLGVSADYVTALGDDKHSSWMLDSWQAESVGTDMVARLPGRVPGLYMIDNDSTGERYFSYWRGEAAARALFDDAGRVARLTEALSRFTLVYFSGISLSLYGDSGREALFTMLGGLRSSGVLVGFDGNYRPAGWADTATAQNAFTRACECADIVLPTFEDEQALFGDGTPGATLQRIRALGAGEVVLKRGPQGCLVSAGGQLEEVPAQMVDRPVDTTAAGDSFNAGYLAGRLLGLEPGAAARQGHALAAQVIQYPGAILPAEAMPGML